ncbi:FkbM family methyltransferase [Luteibacter sp. HA06]
MENLHRTDSDLGMAFRQVGRRGNGAVDVAIADPSSTEAPVAVEPLAAPLRTWKGGVKSVLRRVARGVWRMARPFARGPIHRVRGFLVQPLLDEVNAVRAALRDDVINTQTWAHQEQLKQTVSVLQEIVASRDKLVRDLALAAERVASLQSELSGHEKARASREDARFDRTHARLEREYARLDRIEAYALKGASRIAVPTGDNAVLVRTAVGYVNCDGRDVALLAELLEAGELESGTRLLIESIVQPGMTFVDVGANIGMHTVAAGRALRGHGRVVAFEPFPRTMSLLRETIWMNGLDAICELHGAAVSSKAGETTLFLGRTSGHHSLFPLPGETGEVTVQLVTLDDVIGHNERVDVIKIDAEGAELDVIHGAGKLLSANPNVSLIVEFGPAHLARTGDSVERWLAQFTVLGFDYQVIDPRTGVLSTRTPAELALEVSVNLYMRRRQA